MLLITSRAINFLTIKEQTCCLPRSQMYYVHCIWKAGWTLRLTVQNLTVILPRVLFWYRVYYSHCRCSSRAGFSTSCCGEVFVLFHVCLYIQSNDDKCCLFSILRIKFLWEINLFYSSHSFCETTIPFFFLWINTFVTIYNIMCKR